jgi:hypothetical protein
MLASGTETRISWFRLFNELKLAGWSLYRIENDLSISKSTLIGWKTGSEPNHADGERLIRLWRTVTGHGRDALPLERRYPSAFRRK